MLRALGAGGTVAEAERVLSVIENFSDMAGVAELAEDLGVSRQSICNWAAGRGGTGFPAPLFKLRATPVWSRDAVRDWFASRE